MGLIGRLAHEFNRIEGVGNKRSLIDKKAKNGPFQAKPCPMQHTRYSGRTWRSLLAPGFLDAHLKDAE
jgi:hypothetical protein